jgi:hypothetical protein
MCLPLAWHFCNKSNTSKLEKIQARALRFIYEDYESTYDELLEKAKVPSLKVRRMRTMAIEYSYTCVIDLLHTNNNVCSAVLLGHSFIRRLNDFMKDNPS